MSRQVIGPGQSNVTVVTPDANVTIVSINNNLVVLNVADGGNTVTYPSLLRAVYMTGQPVNMTPAQIIAASQFVGAVGVAGPGNFNIAVANVPVGNYYVQIIIDYP